MRCDVDGESYDGFEPAKFDNIPTRPLGNHHGPLLVLAWFDGDPEIWYVESLDKLENLREYYRKQPFGKQTVPFTICLILDTQ